MPYNYYYDVLLQCKYSCFGSKLMVRHIGKSHTKIKKIGNNNNNIIGKKKSNNKVGGGGGIDESSRKKVTRGIRRISNGSLLSSPPLPSLPLEFPCHHCDKVLTQKVNLDRHFESFHQEIKCSVCSATLKGHNQLRHHLRAAHKNSKIDVNEEYSKAVTFCNICTKYFR